MKSFYCGPSFNYCISQRLQFYPFATRTSTRLRLNENELFYSTLFRSLSSPAVCLHPDDVMSDELCTLLFWQERFVPAVGQEKRSRIQDTCDHSVRQQRGTVKQDSSTFVRNHRQTRPRYECTEFSEFLTQFL